jgi:hypothetical protein
MNVERYVVYCTDFALGRGPEHGLAEGKDFHQTTNFNERHKRLYDPC